MVILQVGMVTVVKMGSKSDHAKTPLKLLIIKELSFSHPPRGQVIY
jgi:hypothetical protein